MALAMAAAPDPTAAANMRDGPPDVPKLGKLPVAAVSSKYYIGMGAAITWLPVLIAYGTGGGSMFSSLTIVAEQ
eukprot:6445970-Prymnesium_polylepis.1